MMHMLVLCRTFKEVCELCTQVSCLEAIRKHLLAEPGGTARAVVDIFSVKELLEDSVAALEVGKPSPCQTLMSFIALEGVRCAAV